MPLKCTEVWQRSRILEKMRWLVALRHDCVGWRQMVIAYHQHWQK
nr:MAG TPA: hypothetical protein [Caudoviricetes sp.]